jgi:4'-phosphopantetheinyl transferase EntD
LHPEEAAHVERAAPKRIQEFAAGRLCARRAMNEFGITGFALRVADDRRPIWPDGIVGSISHTSGLCAAAVAESRHYVSLGLDCEVLGAVSADVLPTVCLDLERDWIRSLPAADQGVAATLIFSAKEAFYKCQYPVTREWLDFHDLHVEPFTLGASCGVCRVSATRRIAFADCAVLPMLANYVIDGNFAATGFALSRDAAMLDGRQAVSSR